MEKLIVRFSLVAGAVFMMLIFVSSYATEPVEANNFNSSLPQIVKAPDINKQFYWAGEPVR